MVSKAFGLSRVADNDLSTFFVDSANNSISVNGQYISTVPSFRNRIINGAMAIDQRYAGVVQTITAGGALAYTIDRWYVYCTGANATGQRVTGPGANQYVYSFGGASSVTAIGFGQRIEQINCYDMANTTVSLSADLQNSLLTTVTWTAYYANTADTFGSLASPTRTQISNGTFTVSNTMSRYSTSINIPAAANTGLEIVLSVGAQTSGYWNIGSVQLESGGSATPFERRSFTHEETLCQRYYYRGMIEGGAAADNDYSVNALGTQFPTTMRTTPSAVVVDGQFFGHHGIAPDSIYDVTKDCIVFTWSGSGYRDIGARAQVRYVTYAEL